MPTLIRIKETGLKIEKKQGITKLSINTLYLEKGFQVADVISMFNISLAEAEQRVSASINAEAQLRINANSAFTSYLVNLETKVNDNAANVTTQLSTLTTDISTVASSVTELEVTLNGTISAALTEQATVMAGYFSYWDGTSTPKIGNLKLVDGVTYQYVSNGTWRRYDEGALGVANQVKGWVAAASSLVVDPSTGNVTGWQYGDGSGFDSFFKINAEHIELSGSTTFSNFATKTFVTDITYVLESDIQSALSAAANAQTTADGKIVTFYQTTAPTLANEGDIWFDIDDGNKIYTYRSNTWVVTQDTKIADAINSAQTAQTTADGKAVVYYQTSAPIGLTVGDKGDIWIDIDDNNRLWIWSGTTWSLGLTDLAKADMSNVTTIDGGKITTNTLAASAIKANTLTGSMIYGGIIYNIGANDSNYTMKINLNAGEIHIR